MSPIDWDAIAQAGGIPKFRTTRLEDKKAKRAAEAQAIKDCYAAVDARDGHQCRVCQRRCSTTAPAQMDRAVRHHLVFRSALGPHDPSNVVKLCTTCEDLLHRRGTLKLSGDADLRDVDGKLCGVKVERATESGWQTTAWV